MRQRVFADCNEHICTYSGQQCGPISDFVRPTGIITSPQYPLPYGPNENCLWQIWITSGYDFVLTILVRDVNCNNQDDVEVRGSDGTNLFPITTLCTLRQATGAFLIRGISTVLLHFTSHNSSTQSNTGFVIRYEKIPQ